MSQDQPKTTGNRDAAGSAAKPGAAKPGAAFDPDIRLPDALELSQALSRIAEHSQKAVSEFLARQAKEPHYADPLNLGSAFLEMTTRMMSNPVKMMEAQVSLWQDYMQLWQSATKRMMGEDASPIISPAKDDRRFKDVAWEENALFDYIKQSYLLTARWLQSQVRDVEGMDEHAARKVDFYTRQFVDAMAPSNFVFTNPEVLRATLETGGENLIRGLEHLLEDLEKGNGQLRITMTDPKAFDVGTNIAMSKGKVIYQNELMQLIQYTPTTAEVVTLPLLIIPPWINKFYILDLRDKNSFIRYAVDQGHTVFVISWVNPDGALAHKSFADYMAEGPLAALDAIRRAIGQDRANVIGYCLGGTLLATTLAYMAAKGDDRVASATFFTTMTDFSEAGELSVFIDEEQLRALEERMNQQGYLDGAAMAGTFNMLRANDLIWSFVVNNYLLGKDPFPFDLLYWNADSTRMPAAMHSFYLRRMYQENRLVVPGGIEIDGVPIDLRRITTPTMLLSTREDHIAPWKSTYAATQLYRGPVEFVLSGSGHIAGVVNPPAANKYGFWVNDARPYPADPEIWLAGAAQHPGSWWPRWDQFVKGFAGPIIPARDPSAGGLPPLEDAPGSYVRVRNAT